MHALLLIAAFLLTARAISEPTCSLEKHINTCGSAHIDETQCLEIGCCWKSGATPSENLCFYKNDGYKFFSLTADRVECGHFGISKEDCEMRGCLLSPKFGEPWCFFPNTNIDPSLCPVERVPCGEEDIDQDDCEAMGCCWSPVNGDAYEPACFYSMDSTILTSEPREVIPQKMEPNITVTWAPLSPEEMTAEQPAIEGFETHPEQIEVVGVHAEAPEAEGMAVHVEIHGEEGTGTHPPETAAEGVVIVIHGEEQFGLVEEFKTEVGAVAESPESALDVEDLEENLEDSDPEKFFKGGFKSELHQYGNVDPVTGDEHNKEHITERTSVGCGPDVLFEADCLKLPGCYWVPSILPGDQQCFRISTNSVHRNLGKFWKPEAVY